VASGATATADCPAGRRSGDTAYRCDECAPGTYSRAGATACESCPAGAYGAIAGLRSAACSGPCAAGRYGTTEALTVDCAGPCPAGAVCDAGTALNEWAPCGGASVYCPEGSSSATRMTAPAGYYTTPVAAADDARTGAAPCEAGAYLFRCRR
jgi:hypothetical protein